MPDVPHEVSTVETEVGHSQHHNDLVGECVKPRELPKRNDNENRGHRRDPRDDHLTKQMGERKAGGVVTFVTDYEGKLSPRENTAMTD